MSITQSLPSAVTVGATEQYNQFSQSLESITKSEVVFAKGLSAFEDHKTFTYKKETRLKPFIYMHSLVNPDISFVCVDPFILIPSYSVNLSTDTVKNLELKAKSDIIILCLVSVGKDMYTTNANLMSPMVINTKTMQAEQVILDNVGLEYLRYNVWNSIGQNNLSFSKK